MGKALPTGATFSMFLDSLPDILAASDFRSAVSAIANAHRRGLPVILAAGAHLVKCGLSPIINTLIAKGVITTFATNGAGMIHDFELALAGETSEDVKSTLNTGNFVAAQETGMQLNAVTRLAAAQGIGLGAAAGEMINKSPAPHKELSILATCSRMGIPATIHVAIGTDVIHIHPDMDGAAVGAASFQDFKILAAQVSEMGEGGVFLNVGSAVIMPEVFLKALAAARNIGANVSNFVTINLDMIQHYRPRENVLARPVSTGGQSYALTGHHEIMIPLLAAAIQEEIIK